MQVLALDFDGVIADSQLECLIVGFNSYLKLNKNTKLFNSNKITFNNFHEIKRKHKVTIEKYKRLRPYVIAAFCYYVIFYIIENNIKIGDKNEYNNIRKKLMKKAGSYIECFYNGRYNLQKENYKKWLRLYSPYKRIIRGIKKLKDRYVIAIATNNRKKSIIGFLDKYGIEPEVIVDSSLSVDKKVQLEYIKSMLTVDFSEMHFVDDNASHFAKLQNLGIHCYLALWGYNNKKHQKEARKFGALLINEDNFMKFLNKSNH